MKTNNAPDVSGKQIQQPNQEFGRERVVGADAARPANTMEGLKRALQDVETQLTLSTRAMDLLHADLASAQTAIATRDATIDAYGQTIKAQDERHRLDSAAIAEMNAIIDALRATAASQSNGSAAGTAPPRVSPPPPASPSPGPPKVGVIKPQKYNYEEEFRKLGKSLSPFARLNSGIADLVGTLRELDPGDIIIEEATRTQAIAICDALKLNARVPKEIQGDLDRLAEHLKAVDRHSNPQIPLARRLELLGANGSQRGPL